MFLRTLPNTLLTGLPSQLVILTLGDLYVIFCGGQGGVRMAMNYYYAGIIYLPLLLIDQ